MMASKSFVFRFDDLEVREREFTLTKAGKVVTVEPKAFRTLLFLLHNPQRLISKEELLNTIWGDAGVGSDRRAVVAPDVVAPQMSRQVYEQPAN
jgi:DNA-binding winged helix-turn-helix (wHTH) protein